MLEAGPNVPRWKIVGNFRNSGRHYDHNDPYPNNPWAPTSYQPGYLHNTGSFNEMPGMLKLVGGTTWHWGGATWRYIPNDFKLNSLYGVGRDWPISYDDIEPYYVRAEYAIGVAVSDTEDQSGQNPGMSYPPRSKHYPVSSEVDVFSTSLMKERLTPAGHAVIHEPTVRTHKPYDGRPACQGNNNCDQVCPIGEHQQVIHSWLTSDQIASVANYVTQNFGRGSANLTGADIERISSGIQDVPFLVENAKVLTIVGIVIVLLILIIFIKRMRRRKR